MDVHQCPRCELRFISRPELEEHLREAHQVSTEPATTNDPDRTGD